MRHGAGSSNHPGLRGESLRREAEELTPGVVTVSVKEGLRPDGLDHLSAEEYGKSKLGAIHLSPKRARKLITDGAREAIQKLKADPSSFGYPEMSPPYVRVVRYRDSADGPGFTTRSEHPDSITGMMNAPPERVEEG